MCILELGDGGRINSYKRYDYKAELVLVLGKGRGGRGSEVLCSGVAFASSFASMAPFATPFI